MFDVEMYIGGIALLEKQNACGEHRREGDTHCCARFDPAKALDGFDNQDGDDGGAGGADQHRKRGNDAGEEERDHDPGQNHVAYGITNQRLAAEHEEIPRKGASNGRQNTNQDRCERDLDEFRPHQDVPLTGCGPPNALSNSAISSAVKTSSIGVRPS